MTKKLKIDQTSGTLEIEGTEEFVKNIYDDFKERLTSPRPATFTSVKKSTATTTPAEKGKPKKSSTFIWKFFQTKKDTGHR